MNRKILLFLPAIMLLLSSCGYNRLVQKQENVTGQWAEVETQYQRRADLVPMLVNTVKGAANFEKETLEKVIQARASATQVQVNPDNLDPESIQRYQQAQGELSSALGRLLVSVERYPELKANQNFLDLQAQLEATENRISVARRNFNQAVQDYNTDIRKFPNNLTASLFGFDKKGYFEADAGSAQAPEVNFD